MTSIVISSMATNSTENETILDLEVRQNRSDCLSINGPAREVSAITNQPP
jgi:phenylalanyl-tRNA synthetase beta subunit